MFQLNNLARFFFRCSLKYYCGISEYLIFAYPSRKQSLVFRSARFDEVILYEDWEECL